MKTYDERLNDVSARIAKHKKVKASIVTACLTLAVVVLALVLFVPYSTDPPSVTAYQDSPYYTLIQRINEATYVPPEHSNNFDAMMDAVGDMELDIMKGDEVRDDASAELAVPGDYVEVTDNQVAGVIESDIIKRSTEYIYYLRFDELSVYSIAGEASALVGTYSLGMKEEKSEESYTYFESAQMYLSADCTTLTLVMDGYDSRIGSCTTLVNLDVTDPKNITETGRVYVSGAYISSRMMDGDLLLVNKFRISSDYDFSDESTYLPQVGMPGHMTSVAAEDILAPETLTSTQYTVVCKLDGRSLEVRDTAAFLSYSEEIYVSENNLFATRSYRESTDNGGSRAMTEISCLSCSGDTLEYAGSATVEGSVKNQYSMDEYNGILRVVTSIDHTVVTVEGEMTSATRERNASLYCISLEDFSVIASVDKFAPVGEQAESVRFDGALAYVCTAEVIEVTDPVYFFDLSDLDSITWTDTGTIDGYSSSLIDFGKGYLMGVGYSGFGGLKIEIYEEMGGSVVSVCAYEQEAEFSEEYKSYLIDRENNLIGLGIRDWDGTTEYVLLHFDGYDLNEIACVAVEGSLENMRAVLIDGYLYVLSDGFAVEKVR